MQSIGVLVRIRGVLLCRKPILVWNGPSERRSSKLMEMICCMWRWMASLEVMGPWTWRPWIQRQVDAHKAGLFLQTQGANWRALSGITRLGSTLEDMAYWAAQTRSKKQTLNLRSTTYELCDPR